jgi:DMSO/TMAO reductase YedYZ molybdopterin-dependent catalytic subunit
MSIATFALGGCGSSLFEEELGKSTEPLNQTLEQTLFNQYKLSNFPRQSIDPKALIVNTAEEETPEIAEDSFRLIIDGMVDHPLSLTLHELKGLPYASMIIRHVCVEGWAAIVQWGGVQLSHLANLARARNSVRYVYFASAGKLYYETWDIASAMHPQTILAYQKNFEPLPKDNGGPLRLASPVKLGYKQSKWVTQVSFLSSLPEKRGYWEDQGYEWYAGL